MSNWFVSADDPDNIWQSIRDAVDDLQWGEIIELEECTVVRTVFAVGMYDANDNYEVRAFETAKDAQTWVEQRRRKQGGES